MNSSVWSVYMKELYKKQKKYYKWEDDKPIGKKHINKQDSVQHNSVIFIQYHLQYNCLVALHKHYMDDCVVCVGIQWVRKKIVLRSVMCVDMSCCAIFVLYTGVFETGRVWGKMIWQCYEGVSGEEVKVLFPSFHTNNLDNRELFYSKSRWPKHRGRQTGWNGEASSPVKQREIQWHQRFSFFFRPAIRCKWSLSERFKITFNL